jgi:hypothetical protein
VGQDEAVHLTHHGDHLICSFAPQAETGNPHKALIVFRNTRSRG